MPAKDERGFTLVEMMVAVLVMAVAFTPLAAVFWSGLRTADIAAKRTSGFSIATKEIESLHAVPYSDLGFYYTQSPASWKNYTTVLTCSSGTCPSNPPVQPTTTVPATSQTGFISYTIARYIYWLGATAVTPPGGESPTTTTDTSAYKGVTVVVTWSDQTGSHTVEQDSIIYPGGLGVYGTPTSPNTPPGASTPPGAPGAVSLWPTQPAASTSTDGQEIDLSVTASTTGGTASAYYVQYSTDPTFTSGYGQVDVPLGPDSMVPVQGLAASTTYYFRAYATNAAGASGYSPTLTATTPAATTTASSCTLGSFTIDTQRSGKTYLDSSGAMTENVGLSLNVTGSCTATITVSSVAPGGTSDPGSPYTLSGASTGGQWTGTILSYGSTDWSVGTHEMTVNMNGTATAISHGLLVCTYTAHPSGSPNKC